MSLSKLYKRRKCVASFKKMWLNEFIETDIPESRAPCRIQLKEIFTYDEDAGVLCVFCQKAKSGSDFCTGKTWDDIWKLDYLKRYLTSKTHQASVTALKKCTWITGHVNRNSCGERQEARTEEIESRGNKSSD